MTRKKRTKNEKRKQISTYLTTQLIKGLHALREAMNSSRKVDSKLSQVIEMLLERGLEFSDPSTGELKLPPLPPQPPASPPAFGAHARVHGFANNEDLFTAMDAYPLPVWAATPNLECLHANTLLQRYTGRTDADFTAKHGLGWADVIHPHDRERVAKQCIEGFKTHQPFRLVYRVRRDDGIYGWIVDHAYPRYQEPRRFAGYVGSMYEIAEDSEESVPPESVIKLIKATCASER